MPITRATNLAGLGTVFDGSGLTLTGITTTVDLNATRVNVSGVGTITNGSITNLTGTNVVISGVTTVAAGTTTSPSISPSGDSNTGIFFSATDHLNFSTGGSERARFDSSGNLLICTTNEIDTETGTRIKPGASGGVYVTNFTNDTGARVLMLNRQNGNGTLIEFRRGNNFEGSVSVSDSTVSYNGGHLARWSQLPNNENPSSILKGTVMSNLDEMCEWGNEDNEQLNKTKISDIEGDKNVAGLFVSTSFDEIGPLDFLIGMTGDMIIRISEGTTVERGDLLMSAGDGTAKPQGDGYIQDKTIAKVTSTNVIYTYNDGSYCVPCVQMAC